MYITDVLVGIDVALRRPDNVAVIGSRGLGVSRVWSPLGTRLGIRVRRTVVPVPVPVTALVMAVLLLRLVMVMLTLLVTIVFFLVVFLLLLVVVLVTSTVSVAIASKTFRISRKSKLANWISSFSVSEVGCCSYKMDKPALSSLQLSTKCSIILCLLN